jgi:hypothetical protein
MFLGDIPVNSGISVRSRSADNWCDHNRSCDVQLEIGALRGCLGETRVAAWQVTRPGARSRGGLRELKGRVELGKVTAHLLQAVKV